MQTRIIRVNGMSCEHCKLAVEGVLQDVPGVAQATVNLERGEVVIELTEDVAKERLDAAIDEVGYDVEA